MVIMTIGTTIDDAFAYGTCFDKISESPGENPRTVTPSEREQRPREHFVFHIFVIHYLHR